MAKIFVSKEHELYIKERERAISAAIEELVKAELAGMGDDEDIQQAILMRYNLTDLSAEEAISIIAEVNARASL